LLKKIHIQGFKSIKDAEIELSQLTVLIGANGAGKSNFISFFRFLQQSITGNLQNYIARSGGAEAILYYGLKATKEMSVTLTFKGSSYDARFEVTTDGSLFFTKEGAHGFTTCYKQPWDISLLGSRSNRLESGIDDDIKKFRENFKKEGITEEVKKNLSSWRVYHFHDTSDSSAMKQPVAINDNAFLHFNAGNIASFLFLLQQTEKNYYDNIVRSVRLAAPFFDNFILRKDPFGSETIRLEWKEIGSEKIFPASALSDGTLRFICLSTLLLQPSKLMPSIIIIDEPELGLHPYAITLLAGLLKKASSEKQVIVSTQSVPLVNQFLPEDLLVVAKQSSATVFNRLDISELTQWLNEYALGDLWEKNIIGGRPSK